MRLFTGFLKVSPFNQIFKIRLLIDLLGRDFLEGDF